MGLFDSIQSFFQPSQDYVANNSGASASFSSHASAGADAALKQSTPTTKVASSSGSGLADFWKAATSSGFGFKNAGGWAGKAGGLTESQRAANITSAGKGVLPFNFSAINNPGSSSNQSLIKIGDAIHNAPSAIKQATIEAATPKATSSIKDPTRVSWVEMPTTGNAHNDEVLDTFMGRYTNNHGQEWAEKYSGQDLDKSLADLKSKIDKAPNSTKEDLVERARLIAEYNFLQSAKNYGIYMDYDLQGGYAQVRDMDKQIEELKGKVQRYEDSRGAAGGSGEPGWDIVEKAGTEKYLTGGITEEEYEQARADLQALEQYRSALKLEVDDAKRAQLGSIYSNIAENPEFADYVKRGAKMADNERVAQADTEGSLYSFMTQEEAAMYDALLAAGGKKSADTFYEFYLGEALKSRAGKARADSINENYSTDFGRTVASDVHGLWGGLSRAGRGFWAGLPGTDNDVETTVSDYASSYIRENLGKMDSGMNSENVLNGSNFSQMTFDAASSTGNMLPMILTTTLLGVAGAPATAVQLAGGTVMGVGVYGNVRDEMMKAGYNEKSASTYAALSAASEVGLEKVLGGFEGLGGVMGIQSLENAVSQIGNAYLRFAATMAVKAMGEGTEEYLQDVIDPIFRNIAFSESNGLEIISEEGMYSYLVAAMSVLGGPSEVIGAYKSVARCEATGAYVNAVREANPELYEHLLNIAIDCSDEDISEFAEKLKSGEYKANNGNLGQLLLMMSEAGAKSGRWSDVKEAAETFIKQSSVDLASLKFGAIQSDARAAAQAEWDRLVAANPDKVVLDPIASELAAKTGWDIETVKEQGTIISKIVSGVIPTKAEVAKLDVGNKFVQEILERYSGKPIDASMDRASLWLDMVTIATNAAETETYQAELKKANEAFLNQRTGSLEALGQNPETLAKLTQAAAEAEKGTDLQIGKASFSKKKNQPFTIPAADTNTSGAMDHDQFVEAYIKEHGVSRDEAEAAWNKNAAVNSALNGGDANGQQVRGTAEGRVGDVAGRAGASEVHGRDVRSGSAADAGGTETDRRNPAADAGARVQGPVIAEADYTPEQRQFVEDCKRDGFQEVDLVDGPLFNDAGQRVNAKVFGKKLVISTLGVDGKTNDPAFVTCVGKHEKLHLWLDALGLDRGKTVRRLVEAILPNERIRQAIYEKYVNAYTRAYSRLSGVELADAIYEEILCDMFGGINFRGSNANNYQEVASRMIAQEGFREQYLKNGPAKTQQTSQVETTATEQTAQETATETGPPETTAAEQETATETGPPADTIEDRVRRDMGEDEDSRPDLADLLNEADYDGEYNPSFDEYYSVAGKDHWMDDDYSVAADTPKQEPDFLDPYRADTNANVPPDTRTFPGERPMHDGLEKFSLSSMAEGAGFELRLNSAGYPYQVIDKATGKPVTQVTADMMRGTPMGDLIEMGKEINPNIDAEGQYQMMADLMNLVIKYDDAALVWEIAGSQLFSAIKSNSDTQYNRTIDFSTICKKTQAIVDAMSKTMIKLGRGLTRREVEAVYLATGKAGESTPCPVCYVFSRWMGIGNLLGQINTFQNLFYDYDQTTKKWTSKGNAEEYISFMEDVEREARAFADEKIRTAKDPEKTRNLYYDKDTGEFKIGKAISNMKPNSAATSAIKKLSAHQQATARIAEINRLMETATPADQAKYKAMIKELKTLSLVTYNKDGSVKSDKKLRDAQAALETANKGIERYELFQWLSSTMLMKQQKTENGKAVFDANGEAVMSWAVNPNFKPVPPDILFDLNRGGDFADGYPLTWAFRTGKGCAMGKAITPYADARVGETIQGVASDINKIRVGEGANEFLNGSTKKRRETLESARRKMRQQNLIGGMRYQSTSDFRYEYGSDYLLTFFEMQAMGANVQLYTKVIEAVDFLASTGADCNLSLMPLCDGYKVNPDGSKELIFSDVTGINHEAAFKKVKQYDNVQCILVGINDTNILLALESTDVTFVIPFHGSGQSVHQIQTLMNLLGENLNVMEAQDYTKVQSDHASPDQTDEQKAMWQLRLDIIQGKLEGGVSAEQQALMDKNPHLAKLYNMFYVDQSEPAYHNYLASAQAKQIFPYEYWDKTSTYENADVNGEIFKSYCESMGIIPRFSGRDSGGKETGFGNFAYGGENGKSVKGYWKLLIDRKMYSNTYDENGNWTGYGTYRDQQQIDMSNVKLSDLDPKTGAAQFTKGEMSKPINPEKTDSIVEESIKQIEILNANGDIYDRTALTPQARDKLTRNDPNAQPSSADLMRQKMDEMGLERNSVAGLTPDGTDNIIDSTTDNTEGIDNDGRVAQDSSAGQSRGRIERRVPEDDRRGISTGDGRRIGRLPQWEKLTERQQSRAKDIALRFANENSTEEGRAFRNAFRDDDAFAKRMYTTAADGLFDEFAPFFENTSELLSQLEALQTQEPSPVDRETQAISENSQKALDYFGETRQPREAGYMLANGKLLDFSGRSENLANYGTRLVGHHELENALGEDYGGDTESGARNSFLHEGNIRLAPEVGGIEIMMAPTSEQLEGLKTYIRSFGGEVTLDVTGEDGSNVFSESYPTGTRSDEVLLDITEYFENGTKPSDRFPEMYSLASVDPVEPKSDGWQRTHSTAEAMEAYPNLWNVAAEESEKRNPTQIASTQGTYRNIYKILQQQGFTGTILDASSGLGIGTQIGRDEFGFDVEDIEPYPDKSYKPMYTDYSKLDKQYDAIISSAVLNVLPQDQRDALVVKMGQLLKDGGKMYITTRGKDVDSLAKTGKNIHLGPMEWIETVKGSYQKGFTQNELKAYLQDALGPGFTVELSNKENGGKFNNNTSIVVTKEGGADTARYSVADDTDNHFPQGSLESDMYDLLKADGPEGVEQVINKQLSQAQANRERQSTKPLIPTADQVIPVGEVERKVQRNQLDELIKKYGELGKGENPAREISLPKKTGADHFVRRFIQNVEEAPHTSQRTVEMAERAVVTKSDIANYARISDTKANNAADKYYATYGYGKMLKEWNALVDSNQRVTKWDIAKGERLLIEADAQGDTQAVMRLVGDLAAMGTEAGQVVQAMRLLKKMGPVGQLYYFQKAVDRMNKKYAGRIVNGRMAPIVINQKLAEKVMLASTQEEIDKAMDDLIKDTAKQLPVSLADKWNAWRYLSMLGNPRTHIRNIFGNALFRPLITTKDLLAAAGETIFLKDRSQRTKSASFLLSGGRASAKYRDVVNFANSDFKVMQAEINGTGKMNTANKLLSEREIFKSPGLGKVLNALSEFNDNWLNREDGWFLKKAYVNALSEYMIAQGLTAEDIATDSKALNQARQYAVLEAQKATYRDYCDLANALNSLRNRDNAWSQILVDGIMPFTKTPANILRRGVEYSPIGLATGIYDALVKVKRGDITAAEAIDHIAAGMTGTGVALLGAFLASMGIARGADDDDKKKAELERAQGHQEYSLEIAGRSFTVDWVAPMSLPFFTGVEAYKRISNGGAMDFYDVADLATLIAEPMLSLSMLDGLNQTLTAASYGDNNALQSVLTQIGSSYLSQGLPTLGAQIARTLDPYRRANYVDKNSNMPSWMQTFVQQSMGKIPGVAGEKMAYVDMWGRKQTAGGLGMRALENFLFPWYMKNLNENPVEHELLRLSEATGNSDVLPGTLSKCFSSDGQTLNLSADQYEKLKIANGRYALETLGELMRTPAYSALDDEQKVAAVKNALKLTSAASKQTVAEYKADAWIQRAIDQDNWQDAIMFHTIQSMDSGLTNYQLIECMYWLTPEDQGKLITAQYTPQTNMTDYTKKKYKFILDDDMKARSREIYEQLFWVEYPKLYSSQAWANADIAGRADLVKKLQTDVGKAARSAYGDELRAQGVTSVYLDDPMEEAEEIAAMINELGYEP